MGYKHEVHDGPTEIVALQKFVAICSNVLDEESKLGKIHRFSVSTFQGPFYGTLLPAEHSSSTALLDAPVCSTSILLACHPPTHSLTLVLTQ